MGVVGRSGAGKSTTLECLMGLLPLSNGQVLWDGIKLKNRLADMNVTIGLCPQYDSFWDDLTVYDNLYLNGIIL